MDNHIAYENFDLFIGYGPAGRYRAKVQRSLAGNASADFALPFSEEEIASFLWQQLGASRQYGAADEDGQHLDIEAFGRSLYESVFGGDVGLKLRDNLVIAEERGIGLRIRVQIDPDLPALADLPWEYLCSTAGDYIARSSKTPLVRYLEVGCGEPLTPVRPPLDVLAVLSNPADVPPLQVDKEWQRLREVTSPLEERGLLRLERLQNPTPARLRQALRGPVNVLHFVGHGFFDDSQNLGGLIFEEDENRGTKVVTARELAELLQDSRTLRLVFLNACEGAVSGRSDSFAGVAQGLVQRCVPAVLAMQFPISDAAAIALSREFYSALADGYPMDAALSEARRAVMDAGGPLEWGTPVLFSRSDDNRLIEMPEGDARLVIERQSWEPETILIEGGPFLMGSQPGEGIPEHETPQHEVDLPDFRIGRFPVTNLEYREFVQTEENTPDLPLNAGWFNREPPADKLNRPVTGVSWHDAQRYCRWLAARTRRRYRLPSEAEWEKAACWTREAISRDLDERKRRYPWGSAWKDGLCNTASAGVSAVDMHRSGASAYGVEDLLGNVQEWTGSLWQAGQQKPGKALETPDPGRLAANARLVHRGGSFKSQSSDVRCSARGHANPDDRLPQRGFRIAMEI